MREQHRPDAAEAGQEEAADKADRAFGPAITGWTYRFADPAVERRYLAAMAPHAQRRLITLIWVAFCVILSRLAGPAIGLFHDPATAAALPPRILQIVICGAALVVLRRARGYLQIEALSFAFVASYLALRCWALPNMSNDGSVALVIGTIALLYFGSPLRITILAPVMVLGSACMLAAWASSTPTPSRAAIFQVLEWIVVVNLLGMFAMRLMRYTLRRQWALSQALRHLATHDGLTGIANRRHYDQVLARAWALCRAGDQEISLVLLDVDYFKQLNDGVGHSAGDDCLKALAALLQVCVHEPGALVARTGGEEFACVLPGIGEESARNVAERIAAALRAQAMPHPGSPVGPHITISLGVATAPPGEDASLRELAGLADRLVYDAKNAGRNCIRQQVLGREPLRVAAQ